MASKKRVLLLVGSAKEGPSTSESIGAYLLEKLRAEGFGTKVLFIHKVLGSDKDRQRLLEATGQADIVVIACPLYIDSLPSVVIRAMELIAKDRRAQEDLPQQRLLCIVNCGFPEARQNDTALAMLRQFAREAGFQWAGGLALGAGEAIGGRPLLKVKGMARTVIKRLDLIAEALAAGTPVPQEAVKKRVKLFVPNWLYVWFGSIHWKRQAKKHGVYRKLADCPYEIA
jgi:NAD(P)H-dependent FMN reductase